MSRSTQVLVAALVAALVACVSCAPQPVFKSPEQQSPQPSRDSVIGSIRSEHNGETASMSERLRTPAQHTLETLPIESEGGKQLPLTSSAADENTSSELLPDISGMKSADGIAREIGTPTRKKDDNVAKDPDADDGRKLIGAPLDLHETAASAEPEAEQKTKIISEIESILSTVKEQYSKRNPTLSQDGVSSEMLTPQSITDLLKLSVSQGNDETLQEDPMIEDARQRYISIWNEEANRLNAPYMKVTKAWPELGMIYMPVVTQVTDQIKASESVKEAGRVFKDVWEKRRTDTNSPPTSVEPMLKILNNFVSAWLWAETTEEHTSTPEIEVNDQEGQTLQNTNVDRPTDGEKASRHDDSLLRTNIMNGLDARLEDLYKTIFNPKRVDMNPISDPKPADPFPTQGSSNKILLSCSMVPNVVNDDPSKRPVSIAHHRPGDYPAANIRPLLNPYRVENPTRENLHANMRLTGQQNEKEKLSTNPVQAARPVLDSATVTRQDKEPLAVKRPVSPIAYPRPPARHGALARPVTSTDILAPVSFNEKDTEEYDDLHESEEDAFHSSEFKERFIPRWASTYSHRQSPWMGHTHY